MRAYSRELRERILAAKREGATTPEDVARYRVHAATFCRHAKREREAGSLYARPIPGRPPKLGRERGPALAERVRAHHDATLREHCGFWAERTCVRVSAATMSRALA